jgi:hypothetical protein
MELDATHRQRLWVVAAMARNDLGETRKNMNLSPSASY